MTVDFHEALHVVFGDSAAGSLRVALRLERGRILVNEDPLSCGPAPATPDLSDWRSIRESFLKDIYQDWREFSLDEYADHGLLSNIDRLAETKQLVVWAAPSLPEQLLIARLTMLFDQMRLDFSNFYVVRIERLHPTQSIRGMGELAPEKIREFAPESSQLSDEQIDEYLAAWRAYVSSDPSDLLSFLRREPVNEVLSAAMKQLVHRYPSAKTGLSGWDEDLISYTAKKPGKASRIVGYTIGYSNDLDPLGDQYIFYRLRRLGDTRLECPLVSLAGECVNIRTCEAQLTEFGRDVLAGNANAIDANGIDDWVGGVHLHRADSVPLRRDDTLLIPT